MPRQAPPPDIDYALALVDNSILKFDRTSFTPNEATTIRRIAAVLTDEELNTIRDRLQRIVTND